MNTRSMTGKLTDIMECFRGDIDIFCINESWLNENTDDCNVKWIGNQIFRIDRTANRSGGLVSYISNDLASHSVIVEEHTYIHEDIEVLTLCIDKPMRRKKIICNIYRPPTILTSLLSWMTL